MKNEPQRPGWNFLFLFMRMHQTDRLETAARFINSTNSHLFLTGKAGTGKTTFLKQLLFHLAEVERLTRSKTYRNTLSEMPQQIMICWGKLEQAEHLAGSILSDLKIIKTEAAYRARIKRRSELWEMAQNAAKENPKLSTRLSGRKRKKGVPLKKGETFRITYSLVKEGKSSEEIASKRQLAASTIEQHVTRGIRDGAVTFSEVLEEETIQEVTSIMQETKESIGELHHSQNGKYSHGVLRMVHAYLERNPL